MSTLPLTHLTHLQILASEIFKLHNARSSLPAIHAVLDQTFDPDVILKPILSTYHAQFFDLFGEEFISIWVAFNTALLRVWDWGDVETCLEVFWDAVRRYFDVKREDRIVIVDIKK